MSIFSWRNNEALALRREARPHYFLRKKKSIFFWRINEALTPRRAASKASLFLQRKWAFFSEAIRRRLRWGGRPACLVISSEKNEHFFSEGTQWLLLGRSHHASSFLPCKRSFSIWSQEESRVVPAAARVPRYPFRKKWASSSDELMNSFFLK